MKRCLHCAAPTAGTKYCPGNRCRRAWAKNDRRVLGIMQEARQEPGMLKRIVEASRATPGGQGSGDNEVEPTTAVTGVLGA